ncbi:hypothetical protein DPSP01_003151 [Paraphaeosphaeria sporulosa]
MSNSSLNKPSPSNSQTDCATPTVTEAPLQQRTTSSTIHSAGTPQSLAGQRSQSTPPVLNLRPQSITSHPRPPLVFVQYSSTPSESSQPDSVTRQSRSLVARSDPRISSSQSPRRAGSPYSRPPQLPRAHSQPRPATMSSASTPSNTSTAGASSGSNPSYQLPYAPFPYPMPANGGSGQQGGKGGSGK